MSGQLFLAATPIGNIGDASARLREILETANVIAAEDSRRAHRLLSDLGITTQAQIWSFYDAVEEAKSPELIGRVLSGETVVMISDAGMPSVSDPGYRLVQEAIAQNVKVSVIPGPSAVLAALAVSGLPVDRFSFEGFLPRKSGERRTLCESLLHEERTMVFFEAPHRLVDSLVDLEAVFGSDRQAVICRELTKTYEEAITKAKDLGLAETDLQAQRAERIAKLEADRARDLDIIDRTIAARRMTLGGDARGAGLTQFDLRAEAELRAFGDQLFNLGLERTGDEYRRRVVELEQVIADERLAVMRQYDQQVRGITQGLLESLTMGDLGGLPLEARYGAALASLSAAQQPLLDGATPEELAEFARVAQIALPIAKDFLGVSGSFAELVADVSRTLRTAAPGSDPANLGALLEAQVAGADRLELAVISTGSMQTEVLNSLLTELKRLTAQNEAILARASV